MAKPKSIQLQIEAPQMDEIASKAEKLRDTLKEAKSLADDLASMKIELEVNVREINLIPDIHF